MRKAFATRMADAGAAVQDIAQPLHSREFARLDERDFRRLMRG
jgi:hypothetical protein